ICHMGSEFAARSPELPHGFRKCHKASGIATWPPDLQQADSLNQKAGESRNGLSGSHIISP
ncbi:MAG: hypothetical protein ACI33O_11360, partial [Bhargavaea sp.]